MITDIYKDCARGFALVLILTALMSCVSAVTYIDKPAGEQVFWNVIGLWRDSGSTPYVSACSAGYRIRDINSFGTPTCEYDDTGSTMSYWTLTADSGSNQQVDNAETVYINGGTDGIDTAVSASNVVTVYFDGSELPADDIAESKISFSQCLGSNKFVISGNSLVCTSETDPQISGASAKNVCYGTGSSVTCNEGYNFYWDYDYNRLGIGLTSGPLQHLQVGSSGNERAYVSTSAGQVPEYNLMSGSTSYNMYLAGNDGNKLKWWSGGDRVTLTPTGSLGINTTTPGGTMEVRYNGNTYAYLGMNNAGNDMGVWGGTSFGYGVYGQGGTSGSGVKGYANNIGVTGLGSGIGTTVYGVYGYASGATYNYAGYFSPGMYVADDLSVSKINYDTGMPSTTYIGSAGHTSNVYITGDINIYGGGTLGKNAGDNENNRIRIPTTAGQPWGCVSAYEGMMYYDTADSHLKICDNTVGWRSEYTPRLEDKDGELIDIVGMHLKGADGIAKVRLSNYTEESDFSFYLANTDPEVDFFDQVYMNMRCYYAEDAMRAKRYALSDDSQDFGLLEKDDSKFLVLRRGDRTAIRFQQPSPEDAVGCKYVEFEFVAKGYYEMKQENTSDLPEEGVLIQK